jgi:hypothetical protein
MAMEVVFDGVVIKLMFGQIRKRATIAARIIGPKTVSQDSTPRIKFFATIVFAHRLKLVETVKPDDVIRFNGSLYRIESLRDRSGQNETVLNLWVWGYSLYYPPGHTPSQSVEEEMAQ